ncbi:MAG TPA: hypothetical protein DEF45_25460 [Rhodopirellula sp.]|nr:hypothetical protein [Rhodopirellula sp.]
MNSNQYWTAPVVPPPTDGCDPLAFLGAAVSEFPDAFSFQSRVSRCIFINHPDLVKSAILNKDIVRTELLKTVTGETILTSEGSFWAGQRKAALPIFAAKKASEYVSVFHRQCAAQLERWAEVIEPLNFEQELDHLTLAIVSESLFSQVVDKKFCNYFRVLLDRIAKVQNASLFNHRFSILPSDNRKLTEAQNYINETADNIASASQVHDTENLIQILQEKGVDRDDGYSLKNYLRNEIITMLIAGHETTSVSLSWLLREIASRPEIEANVVREVDSVLSGQACRAEHLHQLEYLSAVLDETLRLYPPIWLVPRTAACDVVLHGIQVQKGETVVVCPFFLHRRSDYWKRPEEFNPTRFLVKKETLPMYSYLPFFASRHICIGKHFAYAEILTVAATIYQSHRIELVDDDSPKTPVGAGSLRIRGGMQTRILKRDDR